MKKILFSLAALAALSMVAVGCKKATDGAKNKNEGGESLTLPKAKLTALKAAFSTFKTAIEGIAADPTDETSCKDATEAAKAPAAFTPFKSVVDGLPECAAKTALKSKDLTTKTMAASLWNASGSGSKVAGGLKKLKDAVGELETIVNSIVEEPAKG